MGSENPGPNPETPASAAWAAPPKRLRATRTADAISVELPADLRGAGMVWTAICMLGVVASGAGLLADGFTLVGVAAATTAAVITAGLLAGAGRVLGSLIHTMERRPKLGLGVSLGLFLLAFLVCGSLTPMTPAFLGAMAFSAVFYVGIMMLLARRTARLRVTPAMVQGTRGGQSVGVPVERVLGVERVGGHLGHVQLIEVGGAVHILPGAGHLRADELAWVRALVLQHAAEARSDLAARGVDPDQEVRVPTGLQQVLERG